MLSEKQSYISLKSNDNVCQSAIQWEQHRTSTCWILAVLTIHAGNFRDIPSPIPTTTDNWDVPLNKACLTLVPHERVDFISLTLPTKSACVLHQRGLVTGHWETKVTIMWKLRLGLIGIFTSLNLCIQLRNDLCEQYLYLCPSCRWRWGGSCMEHHSTGRPHAISLQHNPHQKWRSCQAGWVSSFHIAEISGKG